MCGIWSFFGKRHPDDRIAAVPHRGPDDFAREVFPLGEREIEMAHWRLSILDLSPRGRQPMAYGGGRYHVVFNGEIYNYRELRAELVQHGCAFESDGDTEVLLAAYQHWGEDCLRRLRGMFAFCLWDSEKQTLFAARDRFGIKPLYYFASERGVAFASEIKQFTGLAAFRPDANYQRVIEFLAFGAQDHTSDTMFWPVQQLRGGECVTLDAKSFYPLHPLPVRRWYELRPATPFEGTFEEAVVRYREVFDETIRLHLRADVPIGSCLSGGMDSSAIVCAMNGLLNEQDRGESQNTFSCCFDDPGCDERPFMRAVEEFTGVTPHHIFPRGEDALARLESMIWHQDEPVHNASVFSQHTLFESVIGAGVKVMLDGQGGDEQLASYPQFFGPHLLGMLTRGQPFGALHEMRRMRALHGWTLGDTAKSLLFWFGPTVVESWRTRRKTQRRDPAWLAWDEMETHGVTLRPPWGRAAGERPPVTTEWLSRMMLTVTTLPMLLHWEDRNSMAHSIEARVPFLDHELVEFTLSLPDEFKTKDGVTKRILKAAMRPSMPAKVIDRTDKKGFATPEERWLREDPTGGFRKLLIETAHENPKVLNGPAVQAEYEDFLAGRKRYNNLFWRVITFGTWVRKFGVKF